MKNTLQDRFMKINPVDNEFDKKLKVINRKGKIVDKKYNYKYKDFVFNGGIHSINLVEEKFTNFVSSCETLYYYNLKEIMDKLYNSNYNVLDDFEMDETIYSENSSSQKRLFRIISYNHNVSVVPKIIELIPSRKLKNRDKRYKSFRLFVNFGDDGNITLFLIDLYHLGIDAFNFGTNKYELDRNYSANENNKQCISKIADEYSVL